MHEIRIEIDEKGIGERRRLKAELRTSDRLATAAPGFGVPRLRGPNRDRFWVGPSISKIVRAVDWFENDVQAAARCVSSAPPTGIGPNRRFRCDCQ
jgi:hypothetical protein